MNQTKSALHVVDDKKIRVDKRLSDGCRRHIPTTGLFSPTQEQTAYARRFCEGRYEVGAIFSEQTVEALERQAQHDLHELERANAVAGPVGKHRDGGVLERNRHRLVAVDSE